MNKKEPWLQWAMELQSLAQIGLTYGTGVYDLERYQRIRDISAEMVAYMTDFPIEKVKDLFCNETGYQTPKLGIRAAIFQEDKILLVQETEGKWVLPGGWCDIGLSVRENTVKEVLEEAGLEVTADRIIAIHDQAKHNYPVYPYSLCKIFVQCSVIGGQFKKNSETTESGYFSLNELPELATDKNTREQIELCFAAYHEPDNWTLQFD